MRTNRVFIALAALVVGLVLTGCTNSPEPDETNTYDNDSSEQLITYALMDGDQISAVYKMVVLVSYETGYAEYLPVENPRSAPQVSYGEIPDNSEQADLMEQSIRISTDRVSPSVVPPSGSVTAPQPNPPQTRVAPSSSSCSRSADPACRKQTPFIGNATPIDGIAQIGDQTFGVHAQLRWSWAETDNVLASDVAFYNQYVHDADQLRESQSLGSTNLWMATQAIMSSGTASLQSTGWSMATTDQFVADSWKNGDDPVAVYWRLTGKAPALGQQAVYEFGCMTYEVASNDGQQFIEPLQQQFGDAIVVNGLEMVNTSSTVVGPTPEPCGVTIVTE